MNYMYSGRDARGTVLRGNVSANNKDEAIRFLQEKGVVITKIEKQGEGMDFLESVSKHWDGVRPKELVSFFRQVAALISAKVPILSSLRTIQMQTDNLYFRGVLKQIGDDVEDGTSLSESMGRHQVFDPFVISIIRAGEISGRLGESIEQVADNTERNYELTSKIRGALVYPGVILTVAILIGIFVTSYVLPKITTIIADLSGDRDLPWYTDIVMAFGTFMGAYWWAVILIFTAVIGGFVYYIQTEEGKYEWDKVQLKLPVVGLLAKNVYLARFSENFSVLLQGGIPLVQALLISGDVVGNSHYKEIILSSAEKVRKGGDLSDVFGNHPDIPPLVSQMIAIGEESGHLSETLKHVSGFYQKETDRMAKNLTSLIEPILIVFLGGGVGFLVLAVLVPIFSLKVQ